MNILRISKQQKPSSHFLTAYAETISHYHIIEQLICPNTKKMIFTLQSNKPNDPLLTKNAKEISADKILLDQLSPRDAHLIGYVLASEAK